MIAILAVVAVVFVLYCILRVAGDHPDADE
jgi:hypothetical protein